MRAERRSLRPLPFAPTEAKFRPSVPRDGQVLRGPLVDRLCDGPSTGVVRITAPPGYGKTVLASQWVREDPRPFAWVTLDDADNDPRVLSAYIALALNRIQLVQPGVLAALTESRREYFRDGLLPQLAQMAGERRPVLLVLDGVEAVRDPQACEVLQAVGGNLARHCQLVLVGRETPDLDWSGLQAPAEIVTLGVDDLRLSRAEALALLRGTGLDLTFVDADALLARTEGWAAGVYLGGLSIAAEADSGRGDEFVEGTGGLVERYLSHELLDGMSPQHQDFLLRTSVLNELTGPLCDAVLGTTGSAAMLEDLESRNVLLVRARKSDREWYRLHPMFRKALRAALLRGNDNVIPTLHRRASLWFEEHGAIDPAIEHATAAHEVPSAARLVWDQVGPSLANGDVAKIEAFLDQFPARQVASHAKLAAATAMCALHRGRPVDHWIGLAEHGRYEADRKGEPASVAAATALLRALLGRAGAAQMAADAQLALDLDQLDAHGSCTAEFLLALASYLAGRADEARGAFERVHDEAYASGAHPVRVLALSELALLAIDDERWDSAREISESAMALQGQHELADLALLGLAPSTAALAVAHVSGPVQAAPLVDEAYRRTAVMVDPPTWHGVQCREALARAELDLGDTSAARSLLSEAQALLKSSEDGVLKRRLDETWRLITGQPLGVDRTTTLTTAELRVLQLLPTHLSFAQIGERLFVSRNTVKTQALAAYRKLGVSSRSEAVEQAQSLGLIFESSPPRGQ